MPSNTRLSTPQNSIAHQIIATIKKYFHNPKLQFNLPIQINGTKVQQKIWQALQKIPFGKTITYGELAQKIGTSPRVIGNACRRNSIPIVIPCHRVVTKAGLGGYCGKINGNLLEIKNFLFIQACS